MLGEQRQAAYCRADGKHGISFPAFVMRAPLCSGGVRSHSLPLTLPSMAAASRNSILRLINASQHSVCPCHSCRPSVHANGQLQAINHLRNFATPITTVEKEYAFEARVYTYSSYTYINFPGLT